MANPIQMGKMMMNAQRAKNKLKQMKAAGLSKDQTVGIMIDATMTIIDVEVQDSALQLSSSKLASNIMEAYKEAQKELEKVMRENTSMDDLKDMLGL